MNSSVPIFVVGSPRSGTSMMGALLGSASNVHHLGELAGVYLVWNKLRWGRSLAPAKADYQRFLAQSTAEFYRTTSPAQFCCDSDPWNLLAVDDILEVLPEARFLLCFRELPGVCASLERSYGQGFAWAGPNTSDRVDLWIRFYRNLEKLPAESTRVFRYDEFAADPAGGWPALRSSLTSLGVSGVDPTVLTVSHATGEATRPTFAERSASGSVEFRSDSRESVPALTLREDREEAVAEVHAALALLDADDGGNGRRGGRWR
ncbi:hypothetical protein GCM10027059_44530 [Myceligenerans halotolerans]